MASNTTRPFAAWYYPKVVDERIRLHVSEQMEWMFNGRTIDIPVDVARELRSALGEALDEYWRNSTKGETNG